LSTVERVGYEGWVGGCLLLKGWGIKDGGGVVYC